MQKPIANNIAVLIITLYFKTLRNTLLSAILHLSLLTVSTFAGNQDTLLTLIHFSFILCLNTLPCHFSTLLPDPSTKLNYTLC